MGSKLFLFFPFVFIIMSPGGDRGLNATEKLKSDRR
jgi:hypothetical protein